MLQWNTNLPDLTNQVEPRSSHSEEKNHSSLREEERKHTGLAHNSKFIKILFDLQML